MDATAIHPFTIDVSDEALADLRDRLHRTRWPDGEVVDDWSQGVPLAYLREVCAYWADEYDWRRREAALNRFAQFTTVIDGVDIHLVHHRSPHPDALPLILTHGWPGSFVEFLGMIEPLTDPARHGGDPADSFHVIVPSLPGFGFSGAPTEPGWGVGTIADVWDELLRRLGYDRYVAQGGDWGSAVTSELAARQPERCAGIHLNFAMVPPTGEPETDEERRAVERLDHYLQRDSGYRKQQATRPQTLGYGLADSPAGQAAWILEKFWAWSDCQRLPEEALARDDMLDDITVYWVTNTATSSARLYWESSLRERPVVTQPTGFSVFPAEIVPPVRTWLDDQYPQIHFWREHARGGHFAAFEQPAALVADLRDCFRSLR